MSETKALLSQYQIIHVSKVLSARHQARKTFDDASIQALAESIQAEGLQNPILVRPMGDQFELIAGERRLRAVKLLGQETIEAKVVETVSEGEAAAKGLIENLQREDLNAIEEAEGIQALLALHDAHWTQEEIGKVVGKSQSHLSESLRLLSLSEKIKENIRRRIISEGHAVELLRLPTPELQAKVGDTIVKKGLSVMETRQMVNKLLAKVAAKADPDGQKADPAAASFKFSRKGAGFTVTAFSPDAGNFDKFLEDFRSAYTAWRTRKTDGKVVRDKVVATADSNTTPSRRLPQTPEEYAELEAIAVAATGPGPVYAWIFGKDSGITQMMASKSWHDLGVQNGKEGLEKILAAMKKAQEYGV